MKALLYVRANHMQVKGGDLVQLYKTGESLAKLGVDIEYSSDQNKDLSNYDIIHIFNSPRIIETKNFFDNAKKFSKPVAFSTIYWSKEEFEFGSTLEYHKTLELFSKVFGYNLTRILAMFLKKLSKKTRKDNFYEIEKALFSQADVLLPNSLGEMKEIERIYKLKNSYEVVRNAVDTSLFKKLPSTQRDKYVLFVGRIESRKNIIKLINACSQLGLNLKLIGGYDKNDIYAKKCLDLAAKNNFEYISNLSQKALIKYYYTARVHALPSWYETPGLSSMEAACGGCNILSTDRGSTREYFGSNAIYCNPFSQESITASLSRAYNKKPSNKLRNIIIEKYNWGLAAKDTLKGYKKAIS